MVTYLPVEPDVFKKVNGFYWGRFDEKMEEDNCQPDMAQLVLNLQKRHCEILIAWNGFKGDSHRASFEVILQKKQTDI